MYCCIRLHPPETDFDRHIQAESWSNRFWEWKLLCKPSSLIFSVVFCWVRVGPYSIFWLETHEQWLFFTTDAHVFSLTNSDLNSSAFISVFSLLGSAKVTKNNVTLQRNPGSTTKSDFVQGETTSQMNKAQNLKLNCRSTREHRRACRKQWQKTIGQYIHRGRTIYTHTGGEQGIGDTVNTGENPGSGKTKIKMISAWNCLHREN